MIFQGENGDMRPLAKSVKEKPKFVFRKGVGASSKPGGKLDLPKSIVSPMSPSYSRDLPLAETQRGGGISLEARAETPHALRPGSHSIRSASRISESLKEDTTFVQPPVPCSPLRASKPPSLNAATSYSFTDSDLVSDNSFLKSTFSSLPSSTQSTSSSVPSPIHPATALARPVVGVDTFISTGAGPHYPLGNSEEEMSDISVVARGSRQRSSVLKVSNLRVLGKDHGSEVMTALRMAFKKYEPAVVLMKKSLKDPSYEGEGEDIEKFAHRLMTEGTVDQPGELRMLSELLQITEDVLDRVLAREQEVKHLLPGQKGQYFAIDGPVRRRLGEVIEAVGEQEEEEEEKQRENAILAAEFEEDSFQDEDPFQERQQVEQVDAEREARSIASSPTAARQRSAEHGSQGYGKGEPCKKKSKPSLESVFDDPQNLADCEEVLRAEASNIKRSPSTASSSSTDIQPIDAKLARTGEAALVQFKKMGAGDLLPSDDSDEEMADESVTARNPKGKLRFLLGPMDPKSRRRFINAGPAPFTGETAREFGDTIKKARLALLNRDAGGETTDAKQLAALEKMAARSTSHNSYGVQSDGFQLLRSYVDKSCYKKNPCDDSKKVAWEFSSEYTDSQCRYLPWFILIAKVSITQFSIDIRIICFFPIDIRIICFTTRCTGVT